MFISPVIVEKRGPITITGNYYFFTHTHTHTHTRRAESRLTLVLGSRRSEVGCTLVLCDLNVGERLLMGLHLGALQSTHYRRIVSRKHKIFHCFSNFDEPS